MDDVGRVDGIKGAGQMAAYSEEVRVQGIGLEESSVEISGAVVVEREA